MQLQYDRSGDRAFPVNQEVKTDLCKALRSGEYRKTVGALRKGDCYCTLGVLCDLYRKKHKRVEWVKDTGSRDTYSLYGLHAMLPTQVQEWAGLSYHDVVQDVYGQRVRLMKLNDRYDTTFEQMADAIERSL
jgi:hypothetical protein